jgi:hypothetical protein
MFEGKRQLGRCQLREELSGCGWWGFIICLRDQGHVPHKIVLNGQTSTGDMQR